MEYHPLDHNVDEFRLLTIMVPEQRDSDDDVRCLI
jgi:hypothetical protein